MKKIISTIMAFAMLAAISTTAFAAEINQDTPTPQKSDMTINLNVTPTYSVTIPDKVELTKQSDGNYAGSGTISSGAIRLNNFDSVIVSLTSDFEMKTEQGATQKYTATVDGENNVLTSGDEITGFGTSETAQSVKLNFAAKNPTYAGSYSDTVTFNIRVGTYVD